MSQGSTLYRFKVSLSDVTRGVYEELSFRVAMHSSETEAFLLTRVLAYVLNYEEGLEFSAGLASPDEPAIRRTDAQGATVLWIDIGNPTARRLHKASKACKQVRVYTYKDPESLKREAAGEGVHRADRIEVFAISPAFLKKIEPFLARDNAWTVIYNDGELVVTSGDETWMSQVAPHRLEAAR